MSAFPSPRISKSRKKPQISRAACSIKLSGLHAIKNNVPLIVVFDDDFECKLSEPYNGDVLNDLTSSSSCTMALACDAAVMEQPIILIMLTPSIGLTNGEKMTRVLKSNNKKYKNGLKSPLHTQFTLTLSTVE